MEPNPWAELERSAAPVARTSPDLLTLWTSPKGRISRRTYWLWVMLPILGVSLAGDVGDLLIGMGGPGSSGPLAALASLVTLWPGIVASVKRLHDLNHSGWIAAGVYGGIYGGVLWTFAAGFFLGEAAMLVVAIPLILLFLVAIWYGVKIAFFKGTSGSNRYGPDPLA